MVLGAFKERLRSGDFRSLSLLCSVGLGFIAIEVAVLEPTPLAGCIGIVLSGFAFDFSVLLSAGFIIWGLPEHMRQAHKECEEALEQQIRAHLRGKSVRAKPLVWMVWPHIRACMDVLVRRQRIPAGFIIGVLLIVLHIGILIGGSLLLRDAAHGRSASKETVACLTGVLVYLPALASFM